jgi:hypothetical protein
MDLFCPDCMGPMVMLGPDQAQCTLARRRYKVLFARGVTGTLAPPPPARTSGPPPLPSSVVATGPAVGAAVAGMCVRHPDVPAAAVCARCAAPICHTCAFARPDGTSYCPNCAALSASAHPGSIGFVAPRVLSGVMCARHPTVPAVHRCKVCRTAVCTTCDFALPGGVHLCPDCATRPQTALSPKRKRRLILSYAIAIWCTIGLAILFSGALASFVTSREDLQAFGVVISLLIFFPSIAGTALGVASLDRRLANPPALWAATIWNGVILAALLLLSIVGSFQ